jgi:pyruvate ferredoxin oxidoreductase delta subunit
MSVKLCKGGIAKPGTTLANRTGGWRTFKPVYHYERCMKCGLCELLCPESCIVEMERGFYKIDYNYCKGCGICSNECPKKAIEMVLEEK